MRVLRVYHAGRDPGHRRRERALVEAGVDLTLVVPSTWTDSGAQQELSAEAFRIFELPVERPGDVNRHRYADPAAVRAVVDAVQPEVIDIHEEPFSLAARQWLRVADERPVVMYTAQNLDKRYPPPFSRYERQALGRIRAMYPCSRQAASVARGKGFAGHLEVLPLGYDPDVYRLGDQSWDDPEFVLGLLGRMVPEKGVQDAVRILAAVRGVRPARLELIGSGPEVLVAMALADRLGVREHVHHRPWLGLDDVASSYRAMHVVLIPSTATSTWVEQFGRVIVEGQVSGAVVAGYASGAIAEVAGAAGLLYPEGRVDDLAAGVVRLARDQDEWSGLRRAGVAATAAGTWQQVAERQLRLYRLATLREPLPAVVATRAAARAEFGPVAVTPTSARPVAVPVVRQSRVLDLAVGRAIDLVSHRATKMGG